MQKLVLQPVAGPLRERLMEAIEEKRDAQEKKIAARESKYNNKVRAQLCTHN